MKSRRMRHIAALAVAAVLALAGTTVQAVIPASERTALLDLYTSTNGAGWNDSTNWNGAVGTECTWYGVGCDLGETTVTSISLTFNNLTGTLPGNLNNLTGLTNFEIDGNTQLTGSIPTLNGMTNLRYVNFSFNTDMSGPIPALAGLTNLEYFYGQGSGLTGSIPPLTGLTNLKEFVVYGNLLTGSIPSLTGLTSLYLFFASDNQLTGSIPSLAGLTNMVEFRVDNNGLSGSIPPLTGLTNATEIHLNNNQLTGSIPSLTGLTSLQNFFIQDNQLTGSIPSLTGLTSLQRLWAHNNQLTGSIPSLAGLTSLQLFYVQNNGLSGSIPALGGLTSLREFYAFDNQLTGPIPSLSGLTNLRIFFVAINQLSGSIPSLAGLTNLRELLVENNQLSGSIPPLTGLTNLQKFVIYNNQLSGNIPATPFPSALVPGGSSLCPNPLNATPDPAWDAATGQTPWYANCVAPPGPPTAVSATAGNTFATVTFTPPVSDGGSPITSYTATCGSKSASGTASPIIVTGLTNGISYTCTVTASNVVGVGPASAPSNSVTPATVPSVPGIGMATPGNAQIRVQFSPPASSGGSPIIDYVATCGNQSAVGTASPIVVTGLTNGTLYTCTVQARNVAGLGAASAPSNGVTPATVPGPPIIGVAAAGNTRIRVSFSPPASNGGSAITAYTATCGSQSASGAATPILVTGLANGISYTCAVTATNAQGTGPASAASNSVTPSLTLPNPTVIVNTHPGGSTETVPGAPIMGVATPRDAAIVVPFSPPASNGGSAITGYTASCGDRSASGDAPPILVTGLTNGISYTCTVTASNAKGPGPASAESNSVRPEAGTSTRLDSSANPSPPGNSVTFTATVSGDALTGSVLFRDGAIALAGCAAVALAANQAQCVASGLAPGSHPISALYSGDGINASSLSPTLEQVVSPPALNIDASRAETRHDALTDGLLIIRYLLGLTGSALTADALGTAATRTDPAVIKAFLDGIRPQLDVDGDGRADALTDGLLIRRYLLGLRGAALIADVLAPLATRVTAPAIEAYLQRLLP